MTWLRRRRFATGSSQRSWRTDRRSWCDRILLMDKGKLIADRPGPELTALIQGGPSAVEDFYVSLIADEGPT